MSWHLPYRLASIHHAVSIALLYTMSSAVLLSPAKAATVGKITITSAQHAPLVASITMTGIRSADFVASLANPMVYQQMGLTPTTSMSVRFVPTSASTGQLRINTSQPVSMPFVDIVLAFNDNGQRKVIPKTLLMPLSDNVPIEVPTKPPDRVVAVAQKPNSSVISAAIPKRLTVRRGAPPPLFAAPSIQIPLQAQTLTQNNDPDTVTSSILHATRVSTLPPLRMSQISSVTSAIASRAQIPKHTNSLNNSLNNNINVQDNSAQTIGSTNIHSNILTIQITRQIYTKNEGNKQRPITSEPILKAQMHRVVPKITYAESIQTSKRLDKPHKIMAKTLKLQNQKPIELVARLNKLRHQ